MKDSLICFLIKILPENSKLNKKLTDILVHRIKEYEFNLES